MDSFVITREQARRGITQRVAVKTPKGEYVEATVKAPPGVKNRRKLRFRKEDLPGGHAWPDGVFIRVRVPDWRLRNGLAALFAVVGFAASAGRYAAVLVVVWAAVAFCARYYRRHSLDAIRRRFWPKFRVAVARAALLYLVPVAMAVAFYLCVALAISSIRGVLTVRQLVSVQHALSAVSEFWDKWIKLGDGPLFLVLFGAWLLTCLLLVRRGNPRSIRPGGKDGRIWRIRVAEALNRIVEVHGRYSGSAAVTLATLASFTFLSSIAAPLGTQLRLQAVNNTRDYKYAVQKVTTDLDTQVISLLYEKIQAMMPASYRHVLSEVPFQEKVDSIREQRSLLPLPLSQSDPDAVRVLAAEKARTRRLQNLPDQSVIDAPRSQDPVDAPGGVTAGQAAAARDWARSDPAEDHIELASDSGKEVVLQAGTVMSGPFWGKVRELVKDRFPLAEPMVDALSEVVGDKLQETVYEQVAPIVRQVMDRVGNVQARISSSAQDIVANVNITKLVRGHTADAVRLAARRRGMLVRLANAADRLENQADLVEGVTVIESMKDFDFGLSDVRQASTQMQIKVVNDLVAMAQASDQKLEEMMQAYDVSGNPIVLKRNAAHAIQYLAPDLPTIITGEDLSIADANCGCG